MSARLGCVFDEKSGQISYNVLKNLAFIKLLKMGSLLTVLREVSMEVSFIMNGVLWLYISGKH